MSDSRAAGSFITPDTEQVGVFRCGVCWSIDISLYADVVGSVMTIHLVCNQCKNMQAYTIELVKEEERR